MDLSIVIPVYNEGGLVEESLNRFLSNFRYPGEFEIIICNNGSTDVTGRILQNLVGKTNGLVRYLNLPERGIGSALREGFAKSRGDLIFWGALDFPFGFNIVNDSLKEMGSEDLILGSKYHPLSINSSGAARKSLSLFFYILRRALFGLKIRDPQGSFLLRKNLLPKVLPFCDSPNSFFETQFVLYANLFGFRIREMPVRYLTARPTKFPLIRESFSVIGSLLSELPRFYRMRLKKERDN